MDFLTNPFTTALLFFYQLLGHNIVLTIVFFTLAIRFLLLPLTYQQLKSTKATQQLQPKLKEIQEKYKGDREKLAAAQMELYKKNGINPVAGCLPLVVQFPILIGLYGAISRALSATPLQLLDLSHRILIPGLATMVPLQNKFWIWNLGTPDTSFILPILVVASTWVSQKLITPVNPSGDPKDPSAAMSRQMLMIMPLITGFFSLNFASGLSIYWVVGNIAVIAQYAALGRANLRNLIPAFLLPKTQAAKAPVMPVTSAKVITAKAGTNGTEQPNKKRKATISGPAGRPAVTLSESGGDSAPIAAVPLRNKSKAKPRSK
ncbi:MAG: YidC/Oxa1 family membrane protein insertase [Aggregatilineales bacterium]